jgi:hypothetical protein
MMCCCCLLYTSLCWTSLQDCTIVLLLLPEECCWAPVAHSIGVLSALCCCCLEYGSAAAQWNGKQATSAAELLLHTALACWTGCLQECTIVLLLLPGVVERQTSHLCCWASAAHSIGVLNRLLAGVYYCAAASAWNRGMANKPPVLLSFCCTQHWHAEQAAAGVYYCAAASALSTGMANKPPVLLSFCCTQQ